MLNLAHLSTNERLIWRDVKFRERKRERVQFDALLIRALALN